MVCKSALKFSSLDYDDLQHEISILSSLISLLISDHTEFSNGLLCSSLGLSFVQWFFFLILLSLGSRALSFALEPML